MIQEYSSKFFPAGLGIRQPRPATHTTPLTGEKGRRTCKSRRPLACCQVCKTKQSRWTRRNNFARIRRVPQEAKWERATFGFMATVHNALAVRRVSRPRAARRGTMMEGLRTPAEVVMR